MMVKKIIFLYLGLWCSYVSAQEQAVDSLFSRVATTKNATEKLDALISLADFYKNSVPNQAIDLVAQAKKIASQLNNTTQLIEIAKIEDEIYYFIGDYNRQMQVIKEAVLLSEKSKNTKSQMIVLRLLGNAYYNLSNYDSQLQSYKKAFEIAKEAQDTAMQIVFYNSIGYAYKLKNKLNLALENYNKGLQLYKKSKPANLERPYANLLGNSGLIYTEMGNYKEALKCFKVSKKVRLSLNHLGHIAGSDLDIAELYEKQHQLDSAIFYNNQAIARVKIIDGKEWILRGFKNLSKIYEKQYRFKQALYYKKKEDSLHKLMINVSALKKQSYLQAEIDYEKRMIALNKEKEILSQEISNKFVMGVIGIFLLLISIVVIWLVSQKNKKIKQVNKKLSAGNKEKEVLLKEVHHRVKNNLQLVSSLLSLQSKTVANKKVQQILLEGTDRIKSMSLVHQRLYEKGKYTDIEFKSYTTQVVENLIASYKIKNSIQFNIHAIEVIDIDFAITLGLIINEAITNTLKYNRKRKNLKIEISFVKTAQKYTLKIKDNGVGFDVAAAQQKNTLGLRLISILTNQLEGNMQVLSEKNKGVAYNITIPTTNQQQ